MTPETLAALTSVPAAVAVIAMARMFLKHISEQRALDRAIWENHLSKSIAVQSETSKSIGALVTQITVMQAQNQDSMQWARDAMQSLIREIGRSSPAKE